MAGITRFEEIEAWKTARHLTNMVYLLGNQTGFNRDFGLRDQIRRASVSIMSNIAEGFESRTDIQFINFLGMAKASAAKCGHNFIWLLIKITSQKNNSKKLMLWLRHAPVKLQNLSLTLKPIQESDVFLMMARNMWSKPQPDF